jgi:hypothetical protein
VTDKPPLPERTFDAWPRIHADLTDGSDTARIIRLATSAADGWALGPDGPFKNPTLTLSEITGNVVREALLHLLELGLIDIDAERMRAAKGWPLRRGDFLPDSEETKP